MVSFLTESTNGFVATETVGGFASANNQNTFDDIFTEAYSEMLTNGVDVLVDINDLVKNKAKLGAFKDKLLGELKLECANMANDVSANYGTHAALYDQVSDMFNNCVQDLYSESTKVGNLLPIKAVDFPVLIKQQLKLVSKDIIQTETTKSPIIKKHIEQTWVVDNKTKKRYKYPQCFFTDEFKEIYNGGKGLPIKSDVKVTLPAFEYDVITNCTDTTAADKEKFSLDLTIVAADVKEGADTVKYTFPTPVRVNLQDGVLLGGMIDTELDFNGTKKPIKDSIMGFVDFTANRVTVNSAAGKIVAVYFGGYLSNERNERTVTFDYTREEREWKIADGMRVDVPYSLEELEDTKALLDIDLYKKTYNNLADLLTQTEDSNVLDFLDQEFVKYDGIEVDPLQWTSFITKDNFDVDSTSITVAMPPEYITKMFKFKLDRIFQAIADKAKFEDITFVVYGNPRYISLLNGEVNWVTKPGQVSNGVKLDYGYGVMTSGDISVQVVSTKKCNVKYNTSSKQYDGVRIIPYPLSQEQFTFKHYKYTTHILTNQNSAYRSADLPGGSYTYLMGTSRYTNAAVQGIQAQMSITNAEQYIL